MPMPKGSSDSREHQFPWRNLFSGSLAVAKPTRYAGVRAAAAKACVEQEHGNEKKQQCGKRLDYSADAVHQILHRGC